MDNVFIFVFGCVVFGISIGSAFVLLIASDDPEDVS